MVFSIIPLLEKIIAEHNLNYDESLIFFKQVIKTASTATTYLPEDEETWSNDQIQDALHESGYSSLSALAKKIVANRDLIKKENTRWENKILRVLIVAPLQTLLIGFQDMLGFAKDIEVVDTAKLLEDAMRKTAVFKPDVVMLSWDYYKEDIPVSQAIRNIREFSPLTRILVFSAYADQKDEASNAGAHQVYSLIELNTFEDITRAIRDTYDRIDDHIPDDIARLYSSLTSKEKVVLSLMSQGMSYKEIAKKLNLSETTLRNHTAKIFEKLNVINRAEVMTLVSKYNLFG